MCKHFKNAQVSVRTQCCRKWYDCPECHLENEDHSLVKTLEVTFICKKCKKAFRKDLTDFDESDQFCPHCDNEFVMPGVSQKTPARDETKSSLPSAIENDLKGLDARMIRDSDLKDSIFFGELEDDSARLG
ncbi:zinc finger protein [Nadsonia fulvescens var. elongata DSM 6958]|uniref:Zinc finger protein n=1 Tax=Nadsonia fulvescens var. elongata DSM 6958 TaxID=857566 RepID=A0A1E3PK12_9ASCO|nr:zinc finger protein [Nadsonia fulvescens var. elongata DSM 6958]